jgi:predicted nucleic acid-binding protein
MPAYFFDSSALLKRYIDEAGSAWIRATIRYSSLPCYVAQITGVEVVSAIVRQAAGKYITPRVRDAAITEFKKDFADSYDIAVLNQAVIESAMRLAERRLLRGYDAVQLAAALSVAEHARQLALGSVFVGADANLNHAAAAEGLAVENPNDHA